jgi:hypothetical protein
MLDIWKPEWKIYHQGFEMPGAVSTADSISKENRRRMIRNVFNIDPLDYTPGLTGYEDLPEYYISIPCPQPLPPMPASIRKKSLRELFRLNIFP